MNNIFTVAKVVDAYQKNAYVYIVLFLLVRSNVIFCFVSFSFQG